MTNHVNALHELTTRIPKKSTEGDKQEQNRTRVESCIISISEKDDVDRKKLLASVNIRSYYAYSSSEQVHGILTRKSSGSHQAKRRKEEST
jgi:hypothetical protein